MTPHQLFDAWAHALIAKDIDAIADLYCADGEHHFPFRDGAPVLRGREAIRLHLRRGFGSSPIVLTRLESSTVHQTTDPSTIIVECTFEGIVGTTSSAFNPSYVEIITERDGLIGCVRDYENLAYRVKHEVR